MFCLASYSLSIRSSGGRLIGGCVRTRRLQGRLPAQVKTQEGTLYSYFSRIYFNILSIELDFVV